MSINDNLKRINLLLPPVTTPGGNYASVNIRGNIAYVSIQFPIFGNEYKYQGVLGVDLNTEDGYAAFQLCALNVLSHIKSKIGFEQISGINHMDAYYLSNESWDEAPKAVNGASDLFINVLEEKGIHSRSIVGVNNLPRNFSAGITCTVTVL